MKQSPFFKVFLDLLREIYDAENQIAQALPEMVRMATHGELKDAFSQHLEETRNQIQRLNKVFDLLNETPERETCRSIQMLLEEGKSLTQKGFGPAVRDVCLIVGAQKIEHFEITCYGSLCAIAEQLDDAKFEEDVDFDEIVDLLDENLDEESAADKKLSSIAEGEVFSEGINEEAEKELHVRRR